MIYVFIKGCIERRGRIQSGDWAVSLPLRVDQTGDIKRLRPKRLHVKYVQTSTLVMNDA